MAHAFAVTHYQGLAAAAADLLSLSAIVTRDPQEVIRELQSEVRRQNDRIAELEGRNIGPDSGEHLTHLPFGDATVPVGYSLSERTDVDDGGEVLLNAVFIGGHWFEIDLFSDRQQQEWIDEIEACLDENEYLTSREAFE